MLEWLPVVVNRVIGVSRVVFRSRVSWGVGTIPHGVKGKSRTRVTVTATVAFIATVTVR